MLNIWDKMCFRAALSILCELRDQLSCASLDEMLRAIRRRIDSCQNKVRLYVYNSSDYDS